LLLHNGSLMELRLVNLAADDAGRRLDGLGALLAVHALEPAAFDNQLARSKVNILKGVFLALLPCSCSPNRADLTPSPESEGEFPVSSQLI